MKVDINKYLIDGKDNRDNDEILCPQCKKNKRTDDAPVCASCHKSNEKLRDT